MADSYEATLTTEINSILDKMGKIWTPRWIAHAIVAEHKDGLVAGEHSDFWKYCGYSKTRQMVTKCINKRAGDKKSKDNGQYILPGYEHIQSHYVVTRDDEDVGIPVELLTDEEIDSKADVYRKMGNACLDHADELERYKSDRNVKIA